MIALQGIYEKGRIRLSETAPSERANVIVIFPEEQKKGNLGSKESARRIFEEFTGSIKEVVEERAERISALDEKYSSTD